MPASWRWAPYLVHFTARCEDTNDGQPKGICCFVHDQAWRAGKSRNLIYDLRISNDLELKYPIEKDGGVGSSPPLLDHSYLLL